MGDKNLMIVSKGAEITIENVILNKNIKWRHHNFLTENHITKL
jgi:hypothetical protein